MKLYLVVDNMGRDAGAVHGIYNDKGAALLASDNTAAHTDIYELELAPVQRHGRPA